MHHTAWIVFVVLAVVLVVAFARRALLQRRLRAQAEGVRRRREDFLAMLAKHDPWEWKPVRDHHASTSVGFMVYEAFELVVVAGGVYRLEEPLSEEQLYEGCVLSHCRRFRDKPDEWERISEFDYDPHLDTVYFRLISFHRFIDGLREGTAVAKIA